MWPSEIADPEAIVRGVCSPYHVNSKGKLRPEAYKSPAGIDEVSVMRADWIGSDMCKHRAKELEDATKNKIYTGLAVLSAQQIRQLGAEVMDSRHVFEGHADIKHGVIQEKGKVLPPEVSEALRTRHKKLAELAVYYPDHSPALNVWDEGQLRYRDQ